MASSADEPAQKQLPQQGQQGHFHPALTQPERQGEHDHSRDGFLPKGGYAPAGTQPGPKARTPARAGAGQGKKALRSASDAAEPPSADHAALGGTALQLRRAKRYDEALDLYRQAAAAAKAAEAVGS